MVELGRCYPCIRRLCAARVNILALFLLKKRELFESFPMAKMCVREWRWYQIAFGTAMLLTLELGMPVGQTADTPTNQPQADTPTAPPVVAPPSQPTAKEGAANNDSKNNKPAFAVLLKDAVKLNGLIPLHRKDDKVYAEVADSLLGKELFVLISIARGIGERSVLGGMSWNDGDDWIWIFRKVDDNIQVVRKNVRFFADKGSPEEKAEALENMKRLDPKNPNVLG